MAQTLIRSKLTKRSIPVEYLIPTDVLNRINHPSTPVDTANSLKALWTQIVKLDDGIAAMRLKGVKPAPDQVWINTFKRGQVEYATAQSTRGKIFNGEYSLPLGLVNSADHREWKARVALTDKIKKAEKLRVEAGKL